MRTQEEQIRNTIYALVDLIGWWNDAGSDHDRGRDNKMLVITLWDDGSGRVGTASGYGDDGQHCTITMQIARGCNSADDMVADLAELTRESEVWQ